MRIVCMLKRMYSQRSSMCGRIPYMDRKHRVERVIGLNGYTHYCNYSMKHECLGRIRIYYHYTHSYESSKRSYLNI